MKLTDEQIDRVFVLCAEIAAVRKELPAAPVGFNVGIEMARHLRVSLAQHGAALQELGGILAVRDDQ